MKIQPLVPCVLISLALVFSAHAAQTVETVIESKLPSGKVATAEFRLGKPGKPAVLLLHGFLQTRNFPTVASATESLHSTGHTVLAPTLSLGISRRSKSLACEAVHAHTLGEDIAELAYWTEWLARQGHKRIILIRHSFGSVQILGYLNGGNQSPAVAKAILISLTDVEVKQDANVRNKLVRSLNERGGKDKSLVEAEFGHCKKYVSPAPALLSYLEVTRNTLLDSLAKQRVPIEVILGSADDRMGADWLGKLRARGITVRVIEGANHFFDNQHEFDLQDSLAQALQPPSTLNVGP